ncbi:membrane-anchored ubiquitin-fold protein 3-like isoform X4 [Macadamia integrifolia]|uniref:membrane-anchored ubiquitin-fold protein 3-like isoform X4 n=1 Tax=Macadamia integrifolia TaxID=60698 RepID=UPI001C500B5B|nr:membrane-anchored ubiquitin-fold protein 3-like isoform X4 [Macadamia integrifolia]
MAKEELVELKFRLFDGTDIGPNKYSPTTTVGTVKELILAQWPKGKILENNRTIAECRVPVGELPGGVITMHLVVRPPLSDKNEKQLADSPKKNRCSCSIL